MAVKGFQFALTANGFHFFPVGVVGQGNHDLSSSEQELAMQSLDRLRIIQYDFWHEWPGLDIAAALKLEDIALGTQDYAFF